VTHRDVHSFPCILRISTPGRKTSRPSVSSGKQSIYKLVNEAAQNGEHSEHGLVARDWADSTAG
jgi:hypothetical protein